MRRPIAAAMFVALVASAVLVTHPCPARASWLGPAPLLQAGGRLAWPGPAADAVLAWQADLPAPVIAGPVVGPDGVVYVATTAGLVALDGAGQQLWAMPCPSILPGSLALAGGAGEALVVVTTSPRAVKAFASAGGAALFSTSLVTAPVGPVLATADGTLHLVTGDGYLRTYDLSGNQLWRYSLGRGASQPMSVGQGGEIVVLLDSGTMVAVDPVRHLSVWRCLSGMLPGSGPVTGTAGETYFVTAAGDVVGLGVDHRLVWHRQTGASGAPAVPVAGGAVVTACRDGSVQMLDVDGTEIWRTAAPEANGTLGVVIDSLGIIHSLAGAHVARTDSAGLELDRLTLGGGSITAWAFPAAGVMLTVSDRSVRQYTSPPAGGAGGSGEDPGLWVPALSVSAPPGAAGWYTVPPVVCLAETSCQSWPAGTTLNWSATGDVGSAAGTLCPAAPCAPIHLEGAVRVEFALIGDDGVVQSEAIPALEFTIDCTPPAIQLESAVGQEINLQPGPWDPAISVNDGGSGLAGVEILLDGLVAQPPFQLAGGVHSLLIRASDTAGNVAERPARVVVGTMCPAVSLSPVIVGGALNVSPAWSRWVTVLFRLPATEPLAAGASPQLAGLDGTIIARLPVNTGAGYRAYLARFERSALIQALVARCGAIAAPTKLIAVALDLVVTSGERAYCSAVTVIWRP